jgi:ABC-type transport system involved in cytochrome c biogenesis permease subunit
MHQYVILISTLQSHWLMMHVSMMILDYAALLCGSLLSMTILVIMFQKVIHTLPFIKNLDSLNKSVWTSHCMTFFFAPYLIN